MRREPNHKCETCLYYVVPDGQTAETGLCHRYPPKPIPVQQPTLTGAMGLGVHGILPPVQAGGFCGEHQITFA